MLLEFLPKIVAFLAIAWSIRQILNMRDSVLGGRVMIPASLAHILLFVLFELIVFIGGFSPLHLLWLWPLSVVLGLVLLFLPFTVKALIFFTVLLRLTGKPRDEDGEEMYIELSEEDFDENGEPNIIDVDFQSSVHAGHKSEKRRKHRRKKGH